MPSPFKKSSIATPVSVANGGTGATDVAGAKTNLGVPVKAIGTEVDIGTDDAKFVTSKALKDSLNIPNVAPGVIGTLIQSNGTIWSALSTAALKSNLSLTKSDVGLSNVDNTSDATKNSATVTLTNKRINPRLVTAASYTTDTGTSLNIANCDQFEITAQAGALLFNAPGGTPLGGNKLMIRIKDNGTARALTYNAIFRAMGSVLPTTTVLSKTLYMGFIFNENETKWDLIAVAQEV